LKKCLSQINIVSHDRGELWDTTPWVRRGFQFPDALTHSSSGSGEF